ncbi:MAG: LVIVD repeat-containing protein [Candidatus Dormibacteria bacterium]
MKSKRAGRGTWAAAVLALAFTTTGGSGASAASTPFEGPVPRAQCGAGSLPEDAAQGEVTVADRTSGRSQLGYRCNLELVGQYQGVGAGWQNAWYGKCDYYDTAQNLTAPGVQVLDVSDSAHPKATANLITPAMQGPWESLKVNKKRGLLGAVAAYDGAGQGPVFFDVYDIKGDCTRPTLLSSVPMDFPFGHEGNWATDGMTYYGSSLYAGTIAAIDVSNPAAPTLFSVLHMGTHGLSTSDDGNRLYLANTGGNGLDILDTTSIQNRTALPVVNAPTDLGHVYWNDGSTAQHTIPITYQGHPYILFADEGGVGGLAGVPAGAARIIDIGDEANPKIVSVLRLEIQTAAMATPNQAEVAGNGGFGYEAHYCAVDRENDPTAVACGYFQSGIRVFDIRNPAQPREVAYFNPPAQELHKAALVGSEHAGTTEGNVENANLSTDWCSSRVRFYQAPDGSWQLWGQCQDNGFMTLKFTNGVYPLSGQSAAAASPAASSPSPPPAPTGLPNTASGSTRQIPVLPLAVLVLAAIGIGRFRARSKTARLGLTFGGDRSRGLVAAQTAQSNPAGVPIHRT